MDERESYRFTAFCMNRGTDLLIFFRWSVSENEEVADGTGETEGGLIGQKRQ